MPMNPPPTKLPAQPNAYVWLRESDGMLVVEYDGTIGEIHGVEVNEQADVDD